MKRFSRSTELSYFPEKLNGKAGLEPATSHFKGDVVPSAFAEFIDH
ncbi:MAG: hypothetical protein R2747_19865 [Pyrinomonadaceae bacterium]